MLNNKLAINVITDIFAQNNTLDSMLTDFPVTRYQGSKRKIIPWIHSVLTHNNVEFDTVLDAFGGTGMVSYLFKKMGKSVTYNDNLKFNSIIGKCLIENSLVRLEDKEVQEILNHQSSLRLVQNLFKDIYYLESENEWIDKTIDGIESIFEDHHEMKKAIAYYALFQACLIKRPFNLFHRRNLNIRTRDVDRNFGNKTSWEKPFDDLFLKFTNEANNSIFDNGRQCNSLNESAFELDPYGYDLVYLDPPYFKKNGDNETAHYGKCYHFLEGIANYSNWENMIDYSTANLRLSNTDDTFKRDKLNEKFEELLVRYRNSKIVFSYKKGGSPSIEFIVKTMKQLKQRVYTRTTHYKYALNHQNGDAKNNREVLIIGI